MTPTFVRVAQCQLKQRHQANRIACSSAYRSSSPGAAIFSPARRANLRCFKLKERDLLRWLMSSLRPPRPPWLQGASTVLFACDAAVQMVILNSGPQKKRSRDCADNSGEELECAEENW